MGKAVGRIAESRTASGVQRHRVRTVVDRCGRLAHVSVDFADATGSRPCDRSLILPRRWNRRIIQFGTSKPSRAFATALEAVPAQILDSAYAHESL